MARKAGSHQRVRVQARQTGRARQRSRMWGEKHVGEQTLTVVARGRADVWRVAGK